MEQSTIARWTEVQFIQICQDIVSIRNDIMDLMDVIDAFSTLGNYNSELCKIYAQQLLSQYYVRPTKEELVLLCKHFNVPVKEIKRVTGLHNKAIYKFLGNNEQDERAFYPKTSAEEREVIQKFVTVFYQLRKVGIYNGTNGTDVENI